MPSLIVKNRGSSLPSRNERPRTKLRICALETFSYQRDNCACTYCVYSRMRKRVSVKHVLQGRRENMRKYYDDRSAILYNVPEVLNVHANEN